MITYFGSSISPNKVETAEGFLICRNVPIARIGSQDYLAHELQLDGDPNRMVKVNRYEADVFDKATVASFEGKPVTDTHPDEAVSPDNYSKLAKGHAQNVRREGDFIVADLYINDASLIDEIQSGKKREVSCGYLCNYEPDGEDYKQTHIRGNHVAVVQSGRAGRDVAIKDAAVKAEERTLMSKFSKAVLTAFGVAAKDAKADELKALTDLAYTALDSEPDEPAEKAPEEVKEEPAKDEDPEEETKDEESGLEAKLDKLIEMLSAALAKKAQDEDPEEEEKTEDEDPEEEETEDEDPEEEELAEDEEEMESSEVIEEETEDCGNKKVSDAAAFLRAIQPAVNRISNKKERSRVSKAILSAVKDADMTAIFRASRSAARAAADSTGKTSYEKRCEVQSNAYAAHNPHNK